MLTWTNRPYETMWNHLNLFSSKANAKSLLQGRMKSQRLWGYFDEALLEKKSSQLAYSISQAYEYFRAADTITVNTSPLLYFYGMLALAKALIVANNPNVLLHDIKYHGLHTRPINHALQNYAQDDTQWSIANEYAVTNAGVFKELTDLIHSFTFTDNISIIKYKDILSVDPELSEFYGRYYDEPSRVHYLYDVKFLSDDPYRIELCPRTVDRNAFELLFPNFTNDFDFQEVIHHQALRYTNKDHVSSLPDNIGIFRPIPGGRYLIGGLLFEENGNIISRYISPELCDYVNMFILSNCVRYKQEFWGKVVQGEHEGSLGLINLSISTAVMRFPNFILSQLLNEHVEYGTAARYM